MSSPNHPPNHPSFEQLLDWLEGRLSAAAAEAMAAQMAQIDEAALQAELAWVQAFSQLRKTIVSEAPPSHIRQKLLQNFAMQLKPKPAVAPAAPAQGKGGLLQQLLGSLTFDSHWQLGLAGARGTAPPVARQLIYSSPTAEVALNLHLDVKQKSFTLFGQRLPLDTQSAAGAAVQLLQNEHEIGITMTDDLGEFTFAALQPGEYQLVISADDGDTRITPLPLTL